MLDDVSIIQHFSICAAEASTNTLNESNVNQCLARDKSHVSTSSQETWTARLLPAGTMLGAGVPWFAEDSVTVARENGSGFINSVPKLAFSGLYVAQ